MKTHPVRRKPGRVLFFLAALLAGCARQAEYPATPQPIEAAGDFTAPDSAIMLPASVAGFTRTRLARFTSDPRDVAAAYDFSSPQGGIAATIYIHPAARLASVGQSADAIAAARDEACRTLFRRRVRDMATAHLDAGEPRTRPVTFAKDGHAIPGRYATTLHTTELGGRTQPIRSELYLFCDVGRAWTIEFRFTHAEALDAAPRIAGLMNAIAWAVPD